MLRDTTEASEPYIHAAAIKPSSNAPDFDMFRPLLLPLDPPHRVANPSATAISAATSLEGYMPVWKKVKASQSLQAAYDEFPAAWKESGIVYTQVSAL
jgi:hypothetical protein